MLFPAFGNHECTGYTASNCGPGNRDGTPDNYTEFVSRFLTPLGQSRPWYSFRVDAIDGAWTAKFVTVAPNAWDAAQEAWLRTTLAQATTYTFVVRHEPASDTTAPGTAPSEAIVNAYPHTLKLVGHTHTYRRSSTRELIVGNGGAPKSSSVPYGYATVEQLAGGSLRVTGWDYATNLPFATFDVAP